MNQDKKHSSPRSAEKILHRTIPLEERRALLGDYEEIYKDLIEEKGKISAILWYWLQALRSLLAYVPRILFRSSAMIKNYVKIAFRNFSRQKIHSFINITGLAIGIACCLLLILFVQDELSYDKYHENADNIYRITRAWSANIPAPVGPAALEQLPEIEMMTRIVAQNHILVDVDDKQFYETVLYADKDVFKIFSFELNVGSEEASLSTPGKVVISENAAKKYFGERDPVGKIMTFDNENEYIITGIVKNVPGNSHFTFDFLASLSSLSGHWMDNWFTNPHLYTYVLLNKSTDPLAVESKLPAFFKQNIGKEYDFFRMQALTDIHLKSGWSSDIGVNGSMNYIYIFSAIAFFILLIACINFMNLATAQSANKAKEVGLRKVVGAIRPQLIKQFLGESIITAFISLTLAMILAAVFLPEVNELTGKQLSFDAMTKPSILTSIIGLTLFVGILSGSYPAFFLSTFSVAKVMKGVPGVGSGSGLFRKATVISQFSISIFLIICIMIISNQVDFMKSKPLGFEKDNILRIQIPDGMSGKAQLIKNELAQVPAVLSATVANQIPGRKVVNDWIYRTKNTPADEYPVLISFSIDHDFMETLDLEILEGRGFSREITGDNQNGAFIINEAAVKYLRITDPLNEEISSIDMSTNSPRFSSPVVGVVKDFHFQGVDREIRPAIFFMNPDYVEEIAVRLSAENLPANIEALRKAWTGVLPGYPFEYSFVDENFERLYVSFEKQGKLFGYAAFITITIACLGLFGLVSFTAERRSKELGIRKVLGASTSGLVGLFSSEFLKIVLMANVFAWPMAHFAMNIWLKNFAYQGGFGITTYLLAASMVIILSFATVIYHSLKSALSNPVNSLRYE